MFGVAYLTAFSAFNSQLLLNESFKTVSTLFPQLLESINSSAMVSRVMKIIKRLVDFLNTGQVSVIEGGQPTYTLRKKTQWMCPSHYNGIVWMMSLLHLDMAFVIAAGDWLEVCG